MANLLKIDEEEHTLVLGESFDPNGDTAFHSIRYDFKPYSLNLKDTAKVEIGNNGAVNVKMPRIEGSGPSYAEYSGNKKPCQKECVLIIDNETGTFTLERLSYNMQVKKKRNGDNGVTNLLSNSSPTESQVRPGEMIRNNEPPTKRSRMEKAPMSAAVKPKPTVTIPPPLSASTAPSANKTTLVQQSVNTTSSAQSGKVSPPLRSTAERLSDDSDDDTSSSSDSSSSDDDSPDETKSSPVTSAGIHPPAVGIRQLINEDLKLTESEDSDSN